MIKMKEIIPLGKIVRVCRKLKIMAQERLAEKADVSQSYISRLERNVIKNPKKGILTKIAMALGQPEKLFLEEQYEKKEKKKSLKEMLIESGVNPEAAEKVIQQLRK